MNTIEHGTASGYRQHRANGGDPCDPCREANRRYNADRRARNNPPTTDQAGKPYGDHELGFLIGHPELSAAEVAANLGRSLVSIYALRRRLAAGWTPDLLRRPWDAEDDELLRKMTHLPLAEQAARVNRTVQAVAQRRLTLAKTTGVPFAAIVNLDPRRVGRRTLIAKTCSDCGRLRAAKWFSLKRASWSNVCKPCTSERFKTNTRSGRWDGRAAKTRQTQRYQALSLPNASRSRMPWLEQDHLILRDPDRTVFEKALLLKRSYKATDHALLRHGYTSTRRPVDQADGQWVIDAPRAADAAWEASARTA